jgi:hypothetical protein
MATEPDYYELLEVPVDAEPKQIIATYRRLARQYHPDIASDPAATEYMRVLNKAVEILGDPQRRKEYDRQRLQAKAREALAKDSGVPAGRKERSGPPPRPSTGVPLSRAIVQQNTAVGMPRSFAPRPSHTLPIVVSSAVALALLMVVVIAIWIVIGYQGSGKSAVLSEATFDAQPSPSAPSPAASGDPATTSGSGSPADSTRAPPPDNAILQSHGSRLVGEEMAPGVWRAVRAESCSWKRLNSSEVSDNTVIGSGSSLTVEIKPSDVAFWSEGCGGWSQSLEPPSASPRDPFAAGTWLVGEEIAPGLWQNSDSSQGCSWMRLSSLGGGPSAANATGSTSTTVLVIQISAADVAFHSSACGTWTRISG